MRRTATIGLLVVACCSAVWFAARRVLDRDREAAEAELAADRATTLSGAARVLAGELQDVGKDLALLATLVARAPSEQVASEALAAMLAIQHRYLALEARGPAGAVSVDAPRLTPEVKAAAAPVVGRSIEGASEELRVSPGLDDRDERIAWYRVFARRTGAVSVTAVTDMRLAVSPPELLRSASSRLLVLSAHGTPAPSSDAALADVSREGATGPLAELVMRARGRLPGTAVVDGDVARALGLPAVDAVAAAVPVPIDAGPPWVLLLVTSTDTLDARHAALVRRISLAAGLGFAALLAVAGYVLRSARRNAALRERVRNEERLIRSEKLATAGQLAAGIAHEIGTPLGVARGRAEMSLMRGELDETDTRNVGIILDRIDHISSQITNLLDYVRPQPAQVTTVDTEHALSRVAELLAPQAASRGVALSVDPVPAGHSLRADPAQVQQLLVNLVMNAIDACEAGGAVVMRARTQAGASVLEVTDDGRGIPAADRAHVFDPFFTTKKRGQGTGLGLWVVAQLARAHEAEVEVDSAVGGGSTFRVVWPARSQS